MGVAAAVPVVLAVQAQPAAAEPTRPDRREADPPDPDAFCSTMLLTPEQLAQGATSVVECYPTMDESLRAIGVDEPATAISRSADGDPIINSENIVAVHYQQLGGKGESLSIGGSTCSGGGISFENGHAWNDRISSTAGRRCTSAKHWVDANYTGDYEAAVGTQPVSLINVVGRVSSIRYW